MSIKKIPVYMLGACGHAGIDWVHSLLDNHKQVLIMPAFSFFRTLHKIEIMKICQTVQMKRNWVKRKRLNQIKKPPRLVRVQWRSKPRKWLPWTKHFLETGTNQFSPTTFHISLKSIKIRSKLLKKFNPWKRSKTSSASKDPWKMQN